VTVVDHAEVEPSPRRRRRGPPPELPLGVLALAFVFRGALERFVDGPAVQTWFTIFVSISVQAMPFLVLGVVLSGAIAALVPTGVLARALPRRSALAVPVAGVAGAALPGCECGSVPIAGRLVARGAPPAAALAFLLAAPAINPVVVVATAVAFPGQPEMAVGRFMASLLTAVVVGLVWVRLGRDEWVARARRPLPSGTNRWATFSGTASHDFLHAGGFLIVGAMTAATFKVVIPGSWLDSLGGSGVVAVATMAVLAVGLAICSEADAFVAAGLSQFSMTARLVFLVVGPMVDVKLVALQSGVFGRAFAARFAPLTFVTAVAVSLAVGGWLL
jgi:uncharacterized membrane protein YraQ (UPF0718 family)